MNVYYFGCWGGIGHHLWTTRGNFAEVCHSWGSNEYGLDGRLTPTDTKHEGVARLVHKDGWTALAFWDRSVDRRGGSNSVFLFDAALTFDDAVNEAKRAFPSVWARFKFDVRAA